MLNLLFTIIVPVIILTRFSSEDSLGPDKALALALALPIGYAIYELVRTRKISWSPVIGVVSVLLTGGFRLFDIPPEWLAVKEASIPAALALAILISAWIGSISPNRAPCPVERKNQVGAEVRAVVRTRHTLRRQ